MTHSLFNLLCFSFKYLSLILSFHSYINKCASDDLTLLFWI